MQSNNNRVSRRQVLKAITAGAVVPATNAAPVIAAAPASILPPIDLATIPIVEANRSQLLDLMGRIDVFFGKTGSGYNPFLGHIICKECGGKLKQAEISECDADLFQGTSMAVSWLVDVEEDGHFTVKTTDNEWVQQLLSPVSMGDSISFSRILAFITKDLESAHTLFDTGAISWEVCRSLHCSTPSCPVKGDESFVIPGIDLTVGKYDPKNHGLYVYPDYKDWQYVDYQGERWYVKYTEIRWVDDEIKVFVSIGKAAVPGTSYCYSKSAVVEKSLLTLI